MVSLLRLLGVLTLSLATPSSWVIACASDPSMTTGTRGAGEPSGLVTNTCGQRRVGKGQVVWWEGLQVEVGTGPSSYLDVEGHGWLEEFGCLGEVDLVGGGDNRDPAALCLHHVTT